MIYFVKSPRWLKSLYGKLVWQIDTNEKRLYLSFDDGPHPTETPFVLDTLKEYHAKATFFCIGKNVDLYPDIYHRIIQEGHTVGNHTQHHKNGWKNSDSDYLKDIEEAQTRIDSNLFRPPYGRIRRSQIRSLKDKYKDFKIIMWSVLSGDFDFKITNEKCLSNVLENAGAGAIIVFHDSAKAAEKMRYALPKVLQHFSEQGFSFEGIPNNIY